MGKVYDDSASWDYLPDTIKGSRFIREGHNTTKELSNAAYAKEHPVELAKSRTKTGVQSAKASVKLARLTGGDVASARTALKTAKSYRKSAVTGAKTDPNSAFSERKAKRIERVKKRIASLGGK